MERGGKWAGEGAESQGRGGGKEEDVEGGADYPMELEGSWCSATSGEMFLDVHREHWRESVRLLIKVYRDHTETEAEASDNPQGLGRGPGGTSRRIRQEPHKSDVLVCWTTCANLKPSGSRHGISPDGISQLITLVKDERWSHSMVRSSEHKSLSLSL
jgi:hypothetical protein